MCDLEVTIIKVELGFSTTPEEYLDQVERLNKLDTILSDEEFGWNNI